MQHLPILSAISTGLGSSLSPPIFGCHGDDVKLHHRFGPVDGLRGGATTLDSRLQETPPSKSQSTRFPLALSLIRASTHSSLQNARNCAFASRSVREPDWSQGISLTEFVFVFFCLVLQSIDLCRISRGHADKSRFNPFSRNSLETQCGACSCCMLRANN